MGTNKVDAGYTSYSYLGRSEDFTAFRLSAADRRVDSYRVPLGAAEEERAGRLAASCPMVSLHEHLGNFPDDIRETPAYVREGRMDTPFEALSRSCWDAVFDNLMDGICTIESKGGWKWTEVLHDLGMRLCDVAHQDLLVRCRDVDDILRAHREGRIAWIPTLEGAAMIENELDRIEILYGFGVRSMGVTYSESNALGSGLKEARDGGLTSLGHRAVERMNKVGMLVDCSHVGDRTTLDVIAASTRPIVLSHIGARALWDTSRMAPDEVLAACADKGGLIGIEAAPHTTLTKAHREHGIEAYMEHFEYVKDLVGIDHVGFGPDTVYGDHVGLHHVYSGSLSLKESTRGRSAPAAGSPPEYREVPYVLGLENPTEASHNILRWLVKKGYSDEDIAKAVGGNALRVLRGVWA
jgi:membrane dipeptidase